MSKKYAFLFPGQGAQVPGMVKDVAEAFGAAQKTLDAISEITSTDIKKLLWESDAATLARSDNSQLSITAASLAICAALKEKGVVPSAAMGFSLGEFPALYIAGVLSFEDVIKVVSQRGKIMQEVCEQIASENEGHAPGMSAVMGLDPQKVTELVSKIPNAYVANLNSVKQTVVSGTFDALETLAGAVKEAGGKRAVRLAVAGPYHSPLMQRAADKFADVVSSVQFNDPTITLFSNVTGKQETSGEQIKKSAVLHLTNPVRWIDEEKVLADCIKADGGEWELLEPGPGKVLTGLWGATEYAEQIKCIPINTKENIDEIA